MNTLDEKDLAYVKAALELRLTKTMPLVGDFVKMPDGKIERISKVLANEIQTSKVESFYLNVGAFYLPAKGESIFSFSGGHRLDLLPVNQIVATSEQMEGSFWTFHQDYATARTGVYFQIPVKVWCYNPVTEIAAY